MSAAEEKGLDSTTPWDDIKEEEYPSGWRLAAIVTALISSIFLASLDTVSGRSTRETTEAHNR